MIRKLRKELQKLANPKKAKIYQRFFKAGKGEYGEGDVFLGIAVPESRKLAIQYKELSLDQIQKLLASKIHEVRLIALLILVHNFSSNARASEDKQKEIFEFYLKNTQYINNWDLVDLSADKIVGEYLLDKPKDILIKLARSKNLWERRISIIATFQFIKEKKEHEWTFRISELLMNDNHDLIHKATGWMLREVGKRCSQEVLEGFLRKHYKQMPRTMLRYCVERFPKDLQKNYLS